MWNDGTKRSIIYEYTRYFHTATVRKKFNFLSLKALYVCTRYYIGHQARGGYKKSTSRVSATSVCATNPIHNNFSRTLRPPIAHDRSRGKINDDFNWNVEKSGGGWKSTGHDSIAVKYVIFFDHKRTIEDEDRADLISSKLLRVIIRRTMVGSLERARRMKELAHARLTKSRTHLLALSKSAKPSGICSFTCSNVFGPFRVSMFTNSTVFNRFTACNSTHRLPPDMEAPFETHHTSLKRFK